jgi:spore coat protein U-like protein
MVFLDFNSLNALTQELCVTHARVIGCEPRDPVTVGIRENVIGWLSELYESIQKITGII